MFCTRRAISAKKRKSPALESKEHSKGTGKVRRNNSMYKDPDLILASTVFQCLRKIGWGRWRAQQRSTHRICFFSVIYRIFLKWPKKSSQFGHNVRQGRSENIVSVNFDTIVAVGKPKQQVHKSSHCGNKQQQSSPTRSLDYCLFAPHIYGVVLRAHSTRGEPRIQRNASGEVATLSRDKWPKCLSAKKQLRILLQQLRSNLSLYDQI